VVARSGAARFPRAFYGIVGRPPKFRPAFLVEQPLRQEYRFSPAARLEGETPPWLHKTARLTIDRVWARPMAKRISPKMVSDRQALVYGYCRVSMRVKAAMAERGFRKSHQTVANLIARARLAGAA